MDPKKIRAWSKEKKIARIGELGKLLGKLKGSKLDSALDESILLLLEVLIFVIKEKGWKDSPLDLFEMVYREHEGGILFTRFRETWGLVTRYREGSAEDKARLRSVLLARGMI